jgi:formate--tetrahydrofolate ligase
VKTDIEIAQSITPKHIDEVAKQVGISPDFLEHYGKHKAKVDINFVRKNPAKGKVVLVTAISPTPKGEGKTTVTIGLGDALSAIGKKTIIALREPSLGPVFGLKGGATGGGHAQVIPMEDINLHFTGDFHAIGAANNLLAAMVDNHIYQGNELGIETIIWKRCVDMNDRQLRKIESGIGGKTGGVPRIDGFDITVATEVMAIFCLATDLKDLRKRLGEIVVGYTKNGSPVTAKQLRANGAMAVILKDAIKPNLVQTLEHTPVFIHGGPFANIAHGCNSIIATDLARRLGDYVVTEAGFGADLGAEKFLNIKCRIAGLKPDCAVIVTTVRALKFHAGASGDITDGVGNLKRHIANMKDAFKLPVVVAINKFTTDTEADYIAIKIACIGLGADAVITDIWANGSAGGTELAHKVVELCETKNSFAPLYPDDMSITDKITTIAKKIYWADGVDFTDEALAQIKTIESHGFAKLPVCIAKTPYSFSDDPANVGNPYGFKITVKAVKVSAGAGFVVALTGDIMTMPGLPKTPAAENIDIDQDGKITGLF